jgi:ArsR family transcriptional regulator
MTAPRPPHAPLSAPQLRAVAARFRALGAPSRLRLLDALMAGPLSMGALARRAGLALSNASRQVAELEAAGCVERSRSGREVTVAIADPTLRELCRLVCGSLARRAAREEQLLAARPRRAASGR